MNLNTAIVTIFAGWFVLMIVGIRLLADDHQPAPRREDDGGEPLPSEMDASRHGGLDR